MRLAYLLALCLAGCGTTSSAPSPLDPAASPVSNIKGSTIPGPSHDHPPPSISSIETQSCHFVAAFGPGKNDAASQSIARIQSINLNSSMLTRADVRHQLTMRLGAVDACYGKFPPTRPSSYLWATMNLYVNTNGSVRATSVYTPSTFPYPIRACFQRALQGMTLPAVAYNTHVSVRLSFAEPGSHYSGAGSLSAQTPMDMRAINTYLKEVVVPEMAHKGSLARTCFSKKQLTSGDKPLSTSVQLRINGSGTVASAKVTSLPVNGPRTCLDTVWRGSSFSQPPPEIIDVRCALVAHPPKR